MNARDRAQRTYESAERLAHDRRARRAARKAVDSVSALGDDVRSHGLRRAVEHGDTADHLGTIAESLGEIARRSQRPRRRVWRATGRRGRSAGRARVGPDRARRAPVS